MTKYLNPVARNHFISHILAPDEVSALCVFHPGFKVWPRVSEDWKAGDENTQYVCYNCRHRQEKIDAPQPLKLSRLDRRRMKELEHLRKWNGTSV